MSDMAAYMRQRRKNRRKKYIQMLGGRCEICGSTKDLQFDHKNPKYKSYDFNDIKDGNEDAIVKELSKCVLLCPSCHLQKTKNNKEHVNKNKQPARHGTLHMYRRWGCRCKKCRKAVHLNYLKNKSNS